MHQDNLNETVSEQLNQKNADIFIYSGEVNDTGFRKLSKLLNNFKTNVLLFLSTTGGDSRSAYQIISLLRSVYKEITIIPYTCCTSAGTLMCIGADKLVLIPNSEFSPLDAQTILEETSYLTGSSISLFRGLESLNQESLKAFHVFLNSLTKDQGMPSKLAIQTARSLTTELFSPIYAQINPVRLGEMNSLLKECEWVAKRLNEKTKALSEGDIQKLIYEYPTHSFYISNQELHSMFNNIVNSEQFYLDLFFILFSEKKIQIQHLLKHPYVERITLDE